MEANVTAGSNQINKPARLKQAARTKISTTVVTRTPVKTTAPKQRRTPPKQMQVSITIGQVGSDIDPEVFDRMAAFMESNADMGMVAVERGDSHLQLHIQGMLCLKNNSVRSLKEDIKATLDWQEHAPLEHLQNGQKRYAEQHQHQTITLTDVDHIFFARISQSGYFKPKHPAEVMEKVIKYAEQQKVMKTGDESMDEDEDMDADRDPDEDHDNDRREEETLHRNAKEDDAEEFKRKVTMMTLNQPIPQ
ncbi:hypothetical protein R1sor_002827 [Riccia sorocarpa]|uniref:Uncharacterized protein n=1 Tax=Riccia sorocarpa TaxID=122646 RepID=A0ABD3H3A1_9MARC